MGTHFSGSSSVVGSEVAIIPARATGQRRVITHLTVDLNGADSILLSHDVSGSETEFLKVYNNLATGEVPVSGVIPPIYLTKSVLINSSASADTTAVVQIAGYDEEVGEGAGRDSSYITEGTANSSTVVKTLRAAASTTEVIKVFSILISTEAAADQNATVGTDVSLGGGEFLPIVPYTTGCEVYDLGGLVLGAGQYLVLQNIESGGAAKIATALVSYEILKP